MSAAVGPVTAGAGNTPPVPGHRHAGDRLQRGRPATPSPSPARATDTAGRHRAGDPAVVGRSSSATAPTLGLPRAPARHAHRRRRRHDRRTGPRGAVVHRVHADRDRRGRCDRERRAPHRSADGDAHVPDQPVGALARGRRREQSPPTPFTQPWVVNSQVQLNAPATQTVNGTTLHVRRAGRTAARRRTRINVAGDEHAPTPRRYSGGRARRRRTRAAVAARTRRRCTGASGRRAGRPPPTRRGNARPGTYVGGVALNQAGALTGDTNRAVTLDGANDHGAPQPDRRDLGHRDQHRPLGEDDEHHEGGGDRLVRDDRRRSTSSSCATRERCAVYVKGTPRQHRRRAERRAVAPPRGDVGVGGRRAAGLQGRRAGVLGHACGPGIVAHRGRRAGARPGPGLGRRRLRDRRRRSSASSTRSRSTRRRSTAARVQAHRQAGHQRPAARRCRGGRVDAA